MHFQPGFTPSNRSLLQSIQGVGLTDGLKLCLDAGDADSYEGGINSQWWFDRAGPASHGYYFARGTTSASQSTDPTFNGMVGGLSAGEYWSFDGGDYFTYHAANETWMADLVKSGTKMSGLIWASVSSFSPRSILGTFGGGTKGLKIYHDNTPRVVMQLNSASSQVYVADFPGNAGVPEPPLSANRWFMFAFGTDIPASGDWAGFLYRDGVYGPFTETNRSIIGSSVGSETLQIGAGGNGSTALAAGGKIAQVAMWTGRCLTHAELDDIYGATKYRFGL
jgi:hypothetical protein